MGAPTLTADGSRWILAPAAAATTGVLVGATIVATRSIVDVTGPGALAFLRYAVGAGILVPLALASGRVRFAARDLAAVALLGVGQFGILILLLNLSLLYIPAARAALLFASMPLMTMVLATVLRRETTSPIKGLGVVLTILGVAATLVGGPVDPGPATSPWIGDLLALGSALTGALCSLLYRPYLDRYPALTVGAVAMLASVVVLMLVAAGDGLFAGGPPLMLVDWLAVLFIGLSSAVGYVLWLWALQNTAATNVTIFLALGPITAAVLGALILGESVTVQAGLGMVLVAVGLWVAHRPGERSVRVSA